MRSVSALPETLECTAVRIVRAPEELSAIRDPEACAVQWRRTPLPAFQTWMDGLAPQELPSLRAIFRAEQAVEIVRAACEASGTPAHDERDRFVDDVGALAALFARLMGSPYLRLRFDVVETNACCKFHIDAVEARLICTYRGRGTQYGLSRDGREPETVHCVPTGSPMIFKGTESHRRAGPVLLHRSPPIEGTGETRLLLVLDPIHDPEGEI